MMLNFEEVETVRLAFIKEKKIEIKLYSNAYKWM